MKLKYNILQKKWKDCLPPWVIFEFFLVVSVFPHGPDCHLIGSCQGEDSNRKTLSHDAEGDPGSNLVPVHSIFDLQIRKYYSILRVVWTRDEILHH